MASCSRKEYCEFDILQKLSGYDISIEQKNDILSRLVKENFVDNSRYTEAFVKDKIRFNKWGKYKIKAQLRAKNISERLIENALNEYVDEDYQKMIEEELVKKMKNIKEADYYKRKGKLMRFAASRGYAPEDFIDIVDNLISDCCNE